MTKDGYPDNWEEIARKVKNEAGWKCERCGHDHEPKAGYTLTVHHLDGDKTNCKRENLSALCQRCHLRLQGRIDFGQLFLLDSLDSEFVKKRLTIAETEKEKRRTKHDDTNP